MSDALLPMAWVAAAVKAGDNYQGVILDGEKQCIGEFLHPGTTEVLEQYGELPWIVGDALRSVVNFSTEAAA